jgi:serine/threonine-protein kinase RsbW
VVISGVGLGVRDFVEIRVAARPVSIATVRAVAEDVSARADFDLDAISDLRLAVDEACNQVVAHADQDGRMQVVFRVDEQRRFHVTITAPADPGRNTISARGFGWHVLRSLTDEVRTDLICGPGDEEITVVMVKNGAQV